MTGVLCKNAYLSDRLSVSHAQQHVTTEQGTSDHMSKTSLLFPLSMPVQICTLVTGTAGTNQTDAAASSVRTANPHVMHKQLMQLVTAQVRIEGTPAHQWLQC
jgi:hypothetical protein